MTSRGVGSSRASDAGGVSETRAKPSSPPGALASTLIAASLRWRTGISSPVKRADGGCQVKYSSPLGDETFLLLEGEAVLTVVQTGERYPIKPGDIVGHPKNLDVLWDIKTPFLKKYWVITDAESPPGN